ncbi:tetratricopeptide repeat protein [Nocardia beijingensis]
MVPRDEMAFEAVLRVLYARAARAPAGRAPDARTLTSWHVLRRNAQGKTPKPGPEPRHEDHIPPKHSAGPSLVVGRIPRRAAHFITRAEFGLIREALGRSPVVVVTGMRGAGKTQLAAAYAREVIDTGEGMVGWVNAETPGTLLSGLAEVAHRVGVADPDGDSAVSASRLRDHLSGRRESALLVFDNATDPDTVDVLLPTGGATRVVITSTDLSFVQLGVAVDVGSGFARSESVTYLKEATELADAVGAVEVAEGLGDLPLALSAAAATIKGRRLNYSRYLDLLASQPLSAAAPRRKGHEHPLAVDRALLLSIETTEAGSGNSELDDTVRWLLGVMAVLSPDGVNCAILPELDGLCDAALQRCVEGSLLAWSAGEDVVIMHRLVARVLRERSQSTNSAETVVRDALAVIELQLFDESNSWTHRQHGSHLVDQVEALWETGLPERASTETLELMITARTWACHQLIAASDTARAIQLAVQVRVDCERLLGRDHPDTLAACADLANAYRSGGLHTDAIPLFERALAAYERVLGDDDPDTLSTRSMLANAYRAADRVGEAIVLHRRCLADYGRAVGPDHPRFLAECGNLAHALQRGGRLDEAIPLFEQTVAGYRRVLGKSYSEHLGALAAQNNLAFSYRSAKRLGQAIPLFEQALAAYERVLGLDHPTTLNTRNNLAGAYESAGHLERAIQLFEQILDDCKQVLGDHHISTLDAHSNLAGAYESAGRLDEAIALYEQTLTDHQRTVGDEHTQTLASRNNLAYAYQAANRLDEAIALYEQTLTDRRRILGDHHPDTLASRNNLAYAYQAANRLDEAMTLYKQTLADCQRVLSPDHPTTQAVRTNLALTHAIKRESTDHKQ